MIGFTASHKTTLTVVALVALSIWCPPAHSLSATERKLVDGATRCARVLAAKDAKNEKAVRLLKFALCVEPDHEPALLLMARLERDMEVTTEDEDGLLDAYASWVLTVAERNRSRSHQLLLYKVALQLKPENETALVAEFRAKNKGIDTRFASLLDAVGGKSSHKDGKSTSNSPKRGTSNSSNKINELSEAVARLPNKRAQRSIEEDLKSLTFNQLLFDSQRPLTMLNKINETTAQRGYLVYCTPNRLGGSSFYWLSSGKPYYSSATVANVERMHHQYEDIALEQALAVLCSFHGLSYTVQDGAVLLDDADEEEKAVKRFLSAEKLSKEFKSNMLEARGKYRGKVLTVRGQLGGSGRSISGKELIMQSPAGRIVLEYPASQEFDLEKYRLRSRQYSYDRFTGTYGSKESDDYKWRTVVVTGTCKGYGSGNVRMTDCSIPVVVD